MKVVFRVDSSLQIGMGHISRCLSLADALSSKGVDCFFICNAFEGNSIDTVVSRGYPAYAISNGSKFSARFKSKIPNGECDVIEREVDAIQTRDVLSKINPDWIVVDHYQIDVNWEKMVKLQCRRLMVIEDMPNRPHHCDLLVDHNAKRNACDYRLLIPDQSKILLGLDYLLISQEYEKYRMESLFNKNLGLLNKILISMGGGDSSNITSEILDAIDAICSTFDIKLSVVANSKSEGIDNLLLRIKQMTCDVEIYLDMPNLTKLMADSDLAIGGAGVSAWERCIMGLPSIVCVLADNQKFIADALESSGAAKIVQGGSIKRDIGQILRELKLDEYSLKHMGNNAASMVSRSGVGRVVNEMLNY